jgi:hypothetical protein
MVTYHSLKNQKTARAFPAQSGFQILFDRSSTKALPSENQFISKEKLIRIKITPAGGGDQVF